MIERHYDAEFLNGLLNDPEIRADVADSELGILDLSTVVANRDNILLCGKHGATLYFKLLPGIYEVHTQVRRSGRGKWAYEFVEQCANWMFTQTDAFEIVTRIPEHHAGARALATHVGMKYEARRRRECKWRGERQDVDIYSFRIQDWLSKAYVYKHVGQKFHDFLNSEAARLGVRDEAHGDDPQHNIVVGATLAMLDAGHFHKALMVYNRWALTTRHRLVHLTNTTPVTIRFDLGDLVIQDGTMRVEAIAA